MTEATFTRALLAHMRLMAPDAVIDKLNDRVAGGRPDVNITVDGRTHFLEIKHGPLTAGLQTLLRKVDNETLNRHYADELKTRTPFDVPRSNVDVSAKTRRQSCRRWCRSLCHLTSSNATALHRIYG